MQPSKVQRKGTKEAEMANVKHNLLSAPQVKNLTAAGTYTDGDGLTLRISDTGARSWVMRLTIDRKRRNVGLGSYPAVGLGEARRLASEHRRAVLDGENPVEDKKAATEERKAKAAIPTFADVATTVIDMRRPTWSSDRHAKQWVESLTNHAFPIIGRKRVDEITTADTLAVLTPIWVAKAETATRVRQRMETVFDFAIAQRWRTDNPANGALTKALPRRPRVKQHHPALPFTDVPATVAAIRESNARPATRMGFEFLILTAARAGEVVGATWNEVDLDSKTWVIPARRMKARREHRVPLSDRAVAILEEARERFGDDGLLFPSNRKQGALSNEAFRVLLNRLGVDAVPHGFRSSFRDWLGECTSASWAVAESCLAHAASERASIGYHRTDYLEQRRPIMEQWADYVSS
jgi:integrase